MNPTPEEQAVDAIGWFTKTKPDSEDQQLLADIAEAIRQAEAAARAEEREACASLVETDVMNWGDSVQYALQTIASAIRVRND